MNARATGPAVTVVVPCRDHADELRECLQSLATQIQGTRHEVLVVDSASDGAVASVTAEFPWVRLVRSSENLLAGGARNLGAQHGNNELLGFIDADCIALSGWVEAIPGVLQHGTRLAGGPIMDRWPLHPVAAADNLLQFADFASTRKEGFIKHVPSCNVAIRRADFEVLGGFPADMAVAHDVVFVQTALSRWPGTLHYSRQMRVRHAGRTSLVALWKHQCGFGESRARYQLMTKPWHLRVGVWWFSIPLVMGKRLSYLVLTIFRHRPLDLVRLPLLLPMTLVGLLAYAIGFRRGCRELKTPMS